LGTSLQKENPKASAKAYGYTYSCGLKPRNNCTEKSNLISTVTLLPFARYGKPFLSCTT